MLTTNDEMLNELADRLFDKDERKLLLVNAGSREVATVRFDAASVLTHEHQLERLKHQVQRLEMLITFEKLGIQLGASIIEVETET